jgi:hypothetical protein
VFETDEGSGDRGSPPQEPHPRPIVQLGPPIAESPWSPDFVMQSIEILPVFLATGVPHWIKPIHAPSYRVGWPVTRAPGEIVVDTLVRLGFDPLLAHSTSWREDDGVVLTYVAVVREPSAQPDPNMELIPVGHSELARGDEFAPPEEIGVTQVVEHAFRHLSWLVRDDPVVRRTLADWRPVLETYTPEPFRAFGTQGPREAPPHSG